MKTIAAAFLVTAFLSIGVAKADGVIYRVGQGESLRTVSEIAAKLEPGDVVEVVGDITDAFELYRHGTSAKPITIRGIVHLEANTVVRPRIMFPKDSPHGVLCRGNWNILEGLDIGGALSNESFLTGTAIYVSCDGLTVRNCRVHHNVQGIFGDFEHSGSVTVEFCEFDSNGGMSVKGSRMHSVYLCSAGSSTTAVIENCYFHDGTGGALLKSRCMRNVIRYNWFESPSVMIMQLIDAVMPPTGHTDASWASLHPAHSDIVGNVFFQGAAPWSRYSVISIGGEDVDAPGTEGDFAIAHNLFIMTRNVAIAPVVAALIHGNVDHVTFINNAFVGYGVNGFIAFSRGSVWDVPATRAFAKKRGSGEPVVSGSNNWIGDNGAPTPSCLVNTSRGPAPKLVDLLNGDYRPRKDSPLAGAGMWPLPKGRIVDLVPEYEPRRGIPADLKPKVRRKVTPPSIGPFEAEQ